MTVVMSSDEIRWLDSIRVSDAGIVGGKAAGLGELAAALEGTNAALPKGFAITAGAYRTFVSQPSIARVIADRLGALAERRSSPSDAASAIRASIEDSTFPKPLAASIQDAYRELCQRLGHDDSPVAIRSSATTEDLPGASFAGQHASFLGVQGIDAVLSACRACFASFYSDRAMAYREAFGFVDAGGALAVVVHEMLAWPECEAAGVVFTIDTETGCPNVLVINGSWGLGEAVVQGVVTPDEFLVSKPTLSSARQPVVLHRKGAKLRKFVAHENGTIATDTTNAERDRLCLSLAEARQIAVWAAQVESHFGRPMDLEWVKDGRTGALGVIQARPETVYGGREAPALRTFAVPNHGQAIVRGVSVGSSAASGRARVMEGLNQGAFADGDVLVARATSPDWVPLMRRAAAVVTDLGGRTSHAAIVSRELGVPAVVGTGSATTLIVDGDIVTVSCAEGRVGNVYAGSLEVIPTDLPVDSSPTTRTKVMMNLSIPDAAFRWWHLPADGVGLARIEFIIGQEIAAHPMALLHPERVNDAADRAQLMELMRGYDSGGEYFVDRLAQGIACIAAAQYPRPVVIRLSDFKSNEYAGLVGGKWFEPPEPNPMLGLRGASRYYHERYREAFALECAAVRRVRSEMGLSNVIVMIPFCRTVPECERVLTEMARTGLIRGDDGLKVWMMCEIPSNVVLAAEFAERVDGFSIGSNDLTQLVLGVDRDSSELSRLFDERDPAVKWMIRTLITTAHAHGTPVSFCGQAPSDDPGYAAFLVECGIDSVSVAPDSVVGARQVISRVERGESHPR